MARRRQGRDGARCFKSERVRRLPWNPVAVDAAGRLYVSRPARALRRFDFATGDARGGRRSSRRPGFDLDDGLIFDRRGRQAPARRPRRHRRRDDGLARSRAARSCRRSPTRAFPDRINRIDVPTAASRTASMLVESYSDRDPGDVRDLSSRRPRSGRRSARARRAVDPQQMATARLPAHQDARRPRHAGLGDDAARQGGRRRARRSSSSTAGRGCAARIGAGTRTRSSSRRAATSSSSPNIRGSTGFGHALFQRRLQELGDDDAGRRRRCGALGDATRGSSIGKRVCIAGASYGGYATLMGAIRYPDLYRCGVAWVAVTDPRLLFEPIWRSDVRAEARQLLVCRP